MTPHEAVQMLEQEWNLDSGSLGKLRRGDYDAGGLERLEAVLRQLPTKGDMLDARVVALAWYVPLFMTWQRQRCVENGCDPLTFDRAVNRITSVVEGALGIP